MRVLSAKKAVAEKKPHFYPVGEIISGVFTVMGTTKPDESVSGGHKWQKVYLLPLVGREGLEENFPYFFVRVDEKTLANVGNVWYLMSCQAAIIRYTL